MFLNNKTYQDNIKILKQIYPSLVNQLENVEIDNEKYIIEVTKSGYPTIKVKDEEGNYIYLHSKYDPINEAKTIIDNSGLKNPKLLIFLGLGLGYVLHEFLKNPHPLTRMIIIFEEDITVFKICLHIVDLTNFFSNINFMLFVGNKREIYYNDLRDKFVYTPAKLYVKCMEFIKIQATKEKDKYYLEVMKYIKELGKLSLVYFGNDPNDSLIGYEHMLLNIDIILKYPGGNIFKDKFKNKPCLIISSGPSLDQYLPLIKENQDKFIIICTDSSLKGLLEYGIKPHFVSAIERIGIAPLFEGLNQEEIKDIILASTPILEPEIYNIHYTGPKVSLFRKFAHFEWLEDKNGISRGIYEIGASCSNLSFKLAELMGCNPIILCGQDLSKASTENTHTSLAKKAVEIQSQYNFEYFDIPGNNGNMVKTRYDWLQFLRSFEYDISKSNITVYNTSLNGALITGTIVDTLANILSNKNISFFEENPRNLIFEIYNNNFPSFEKDIEILKYKFKAAKKYYQDLINALDYTLKAIEKTEEKLSKLNITKIEDTPKDILEKIYNKCLNFEFNYADDSKGKSNFYYLLMHIVQSYYISSHIEINSLENYYDNEIIILYKKIAIKKDLYEVFKKITKLTLGYLEKGIEKLENFEKSLKKNS